ncbi:MAG: hypothetical protein IPJ89_04335 [Candidatus Iainarchaeum archaeon]|uniref:Uncharacterized protein n=1 Tax=Candidatus Iainarchaeum sp. TaxID=3101447 RepID=A0A7T9DJ88_9ARCH|nr:MAG: hypothetical protein IPJ89_04335 [Candidatus Diapherotrites archaeon]
MQENSPLVVKQLYVLIHPFYSLWHHWYLPDHDYHGEKFQLRNSFPRKKLAFLLRLWAHTLKKVQRDPHAGVIILQWPLRHDSDAFPAEAKRQLDEADAMIKGFVRGMHGRFGNRLIILDHHVNPRELAEKTRVHRWEWPFELRGKVFGEYLELCVNNQSRLIQEAFVLRKSSFGVVRHFIPEFERVSALSLNSLYDLKFKREGRFKSPLGSLHDNVIKRAAKQRKVQRKQLRRRPL